MMTMIKSFYHSSNCNLYLIEVDAVIEANYLTLSMILYTAMGLYSIALSLLMIKDN